MKSKNLISSIVFVLLFCLNPSATATSSIGGKCTKVNSFTTIGSKLAVCSKKGSSLVWVLANSSQKISYQKEQAKLLVIERNKTLQNLSLTKEKYSNTTNLIKSPNDSLIESKKALIENARNQLIELQKQKSAEEEVKTNNQNTITNINNSISTAQSNINSLQGQISSQQNTVNYSKANSDSAYNAYISAKAQSDFLSYSYQSALNSNSSMLAAKVLCDFGFGSCGIYSSAQYSYNASIISQYNSASARTSGAYASYSSYYSQYSSDLSTLNALKTQQSQLNSSISTLNSQKNQANANISNAQSKISGLEIQINQAISKFGPLESAEKRIVQDMQRYSEMKGMIDLKAAEFQVAINSFFEIATENFISTASIANWNARYSTLTSLQKEIDLKVSEINSLISALEGFLNSI